MNITVIGATGMVGSRVVAEAVARGHQVTAAARRPASLPAGMARPVTADASNPADLDRALEQADTAVLSVRAVPGREDSFLDITRAVLDAAARARVHLLVVGGAGPLRSPDDPDVAVLDDPRYVPAAWRAVAATSVNQLEVCREGSNRDWTYVSPAAILEPGVRTGSYRRGTTTLLTGTDGTSSISTEDFAVAIVDELESPTPDPWITFAH